MNTIVRNLLNLLIYCMCKYRLMIHLVLDEMLAAMELYIYLVRIFGRSVSVYV